MFGSLVCKERANQYLLVCVRFAGKVGEEILNTLSCMNRVARFYLAVDREGTVAFLGCACCMMTSPGSDIITLHSNALVLGKTL